MNKKSPLLWLVPLILLMLLIPFLVPSALPYAGAEKSDLPAYQPVELANPNPKPLLPLPNPKDPDPTPYAPRTDGYVFDKETNAAWEYRDSTIYARIETRMIQKTKVFFTWIQIADPSQLRTKITGETSPVKLAKILRAVVAINGDWYSGRREGAIYRNGVKLRENPTAKRHDMLCIDDQGDFHILSLPAKKDVLAPYEGHIMHTFMFGPGLVIDGKLMTSDKDVFEKNVYGSGAGMGLAIKAQRQAICQMDKLSYLIITTEGPNFKGDKEHGFTAGEVAQLAYDVGAVNAYNLDGGNSAATIMNGVKMNRFGKGGIREITDMIYFITAEVPAPGAAEGSVSK